MQQHSIGTLFQLSNQRIQKHIVPFVIGAIIFGGISGASSIYIESILSPSIQSAIQGFGISADMLDNLMTQVKNGDIFALQEFIQTQQIDGLQAASMLSSAMVPFIKIVAFGLLISMIVSFISSIYFTVLSSKEAISTFAAFYRTIIYIPSTILVYVWTSLRSLGWVPIIGPIIAIIRLPRYLFVPVTHILEKKGMIDSVTHSYNGTQGFVGYVSIVLTVISLALFCIYIAAIILSSMALDSIVGIYAPIMRGIISQLILGYSMVILTMVWNSDL
jgi:hypothetical protein